MLKEPPPQSTFQSDRAYITTPCVCLALGNVAFPSSIFNRLLVSCMSRWPIAMSGKKHLIYCGCGQFDVDRQHRLTLSFISNVIQLRITRYSQKDRHPNGPLCKNVLDTVKLSLMKIGECLSIELDIKEFVKCPVGGSGSTECLHSVQKIQGCEEFPCHKHVEVATLDSAELLKYWFESDVEDKVSTCIMQNHKWVVELSNFNTCPLTSKWSKATCPTKIYPKLTLFFYFDEVILMSIHIKQFSTKTLLMSTSNIRFLREIRKTYIS